jgi:hypothetical protein
MASINNSSREDLKLPDLKPHIKTIQEKRPSMPARGTLSNIMPGKSSIWQKVLTD